MTLSPTHALEARYYTDPDIFRVERNGLFLRSWQFACHASELADPGDYVCFDIVGESLFAVRTRDFGIRAFFNVCQHRAHPLLEGSGNVRRSIVCPYHAWTYELTGELRSGPNLAAVPGFDRSAIRLSEAAVENYCGFIFVNLDRNAAPMDTLFPGVRADVSAHVPDIQRLKPLEWLAIPEACNWKVSVENYSECYHCQRNHPTFSTGVIRPETYDIQPYGYCLHHTTECQDFDRMSYAIDKEAPRSRVYSSWYLWPTFSFQVYPGNRLNTYHWRPIDVDHVMVWRGWLTVDGAEDPVVRDLAVQDRDTTVAEDIRLVEGVQRGLRSRGYRPGPLVLDPACGVNSEHSIATLQTWMREAVDGAGLADVQVANPAHGQS
ncbi:MAG: aromatic ring-hydroxylating dioxygenase subunit alpha [Paracoccaceae bacterium]|nr:aromatic ring-hydroxylating dioxygenase subunit alpha [Paracoccaceae bacterium]MDE2915019.1 aromatic ring-hydroxylating dioxygenase subunit alpha [Paracoccaceae bacterium]